MHFACFPAAGRNRASWLNRLGKATPFSDYPRPGVAEEEHIEERGRVILLKRLAEQNREGDRIVKFSRS